MNAKPHKPYRKPQLRPLGNVRRLTQQKPGTGKIDNPTEKNLKEMS